MHRVIAIFLLLLLPLQAVWAAMEPYYQHESSQSDAYHLGQHHEHRHPDVAHGEHPDVGAQEANKVSAAIDHDHHCCASVSLLPAAVSLPGPLSQAELVVASPLANYSSFDATRIDRPNWVVSLI